jgi:hypothetical protein
MRMAATTDRSGDAGSPDWDPERLLDTPVGRELQALARRILGPGPAAGQAVGAALARPLSSRLEAIGRVAAECRNRDGASVGLSSLHTGSLTETVAAEVERATAVLPSRQREVLALRELSRLSHDELASVMALEPPAVALLLARARVALRDELRGRYGREATPCAERARALRILARRQDSESLEVADTTWIFAHMGECPGCERAHAMMLEASFRYRAWVRR